MTRKQLLATARCRRNPIFMSRACAGLQLHTKENDANSARTRSPTAFPSQGKRILKPACRRLDIHREWNDPLLEFKELAEKSKTNISKLDDIAEQYPGLAQQGLIDQKVTTLLGEVLQTGFRNSSAPHKSVTLGPILEFADRLIADMRAGKIWPSVIASLRLISLCKEARKFDKGKEYWKLLSEVEGAIDAGVYGSYIELLAEEGVASLAELESLYQEALGRYPGTFAAYHLSHNAILPDRQRTTSFAGMSAHLLQGIVTARLIHGDWKNAYLGLDTAFRIWPTQIPSRFLQLSRQYRPTAESYRVFMTACRSGANSIGPRDAVIQTNLLRDLIRSVPLEQRPEILLKTVDVFHAFVGYGGPPTHHFTSSLMKNLESLVPSSYVRTPEGQQVADLIAQKSREIYQDLAKIIKPRHVTLASRIHLIGKTMCVKELGLAMKDMKYMSAMQYGEAGSLERNVLLAAGKIKHKDLITEAWCDLKSAVPILKYEDYYALAVACRDADHKQFFWNEYAAAKQGLGQEAQMSISFQLDWQFDSERAEAYRILPLEVVQNTLTELKIKISDITKLRRENKALNFHKSPIPTDLDGVRVGTEEAMRVVYDKLTTDPLAPPPQEATEYQQMLTSATGIPLGELRFLNWVMLTELLKLAEKYGQHKAGSVDDRSNGWVRPPPEAIDPPISDPDELLAEVKRLRNIEEVPKPPDVYPDFEARKDEIRRNHQMKM